MKHFDTLDHFFLNGLAVMLVGMLTVAALTYSPNPDYGKPVKLYRAKVVNASEFSACEDDYVCILQAAGAEG